MTREEAKGNLIHAIRWNDMPKKEALNVAIKALDQEPYKVSEYDKDHIWYRGVQYISLRRFLEVKSEEKNEPCDNAIRRQDVLDLAKKGILVSNGNYESVCKAINELPSVIPQPCEDAIDRAEAIKIASGYCHPANVAKELAKLPSVTPQPKTGHWEQYGNFWEDKFKCSECGKEQPKILCGERIIGHWSDYCPNCGAKMVEPQESEE